MKQVKVWGGLLNVLLLAVALPCSSMVKAPGNSGEADGSGGYTNQIIVKLRTPQFSETLNTAQLHALSASAGVPLIKSHSMSGGAQVLSLQQAVTLRQAMRIAARLSADPAIDYAEPDRVMRSMSADAPAGPTVTPQISIQPGAAQSDAAPETGVRDSRQWDYESPETERAGIDLPAAWSITRGSPDMVVAVIDSGILPHADFQPGTILPGYDFVSEDRSGVFLTANDGNGRDSDPTDPGDWITAAENAGADVSRSFFKDCGAHASSWHGTHVAGVIAAAGKAGGIVGINTQARILPVRAWGKCGGYTSDIIDAARWAAGLPVPGVPANRHPAQVLNMSLDGPGSCSRSVQLAMSEINAAGKVVVVAAGNRNRDAAGISPASCHGVITVTAVNRAGGKASYSNFGGVVSISAPGGETWSRLTDGVLSTINTGKTAPEADDYGYKQGTSMAAPHVTGIVSLMLSANPGLTPAEVLTALQASARTFPSGTGADCTIKLCGAGIIDAAAAVGRVSRLLKLSTTGISFSTTLPGHAALAQDFSLSNTNTTNLSLKVGRVRVAGDSARDFSKSVDTCSNATLAPRSSCKVAVVFRPRGPAVRTAQLLISSDAANAMSNVMLSGMGDGGDITAPTLTAATTPAQDSF